MTTPLDILIIERMGTVKVLSIKYFKQEELYKKCGFKVYGTRPNYSKIGDKFYDDLIMMCEL